MVTIPYKHPRNRPKRALRQLDELTGGVKAETLYLFYGEEDLSILSSEGSTAKKIISDFVTSTM